MDIPNPGSVRVRIDLEVIHDCSVEILEALEESETPVSVAAAALALSLGRLLSPDAPMEPDLEAKWIQDCLDWAGLYFCPGGIN